MQILLRNKYIIAYWNNLKKKIENILTVQNLFYIQNILGLNFCSQNLKINVNIIITYLNYGVRY